jgi:hypothetical protein
MTQGEVGRRHATTGRTPSEDAERGERLAAVRDCIEQLPPRSRRLVALHFGAGLTHEEIGQVLSMPRPTVSHGIREALKRLKESLARAGVAAIAFPREAGTLGEAICSGCPPPAGFCERVMARLDSVASPGTESARHSARRARGLHARLVVGMVLATAVAAGAGWVALRGSPAPAPAPSEEAQREQGPFHVRWTFEDGLPNDFRVFHSKWEGWRPPKKDRPASLISPPGVENDVQCVLPTRIPPRPLLATARVFCISAYRKMGQTPSGFSLYYCRDDAPRPRS